MVRADERAVTASDARSEPFSDAVFAINITFVGLELQLPSAQAGHLMTGLLRAWPVYLAYLTSFLSLAVAWMSHRALFARVARISQRVTWLNLGLLLTIGFVPFLTRVVVEALSRRNSADIHTAVLCYGLVGLLIPTAFLMLNLYLSRHPELLDQRIEPNYFRRAAKRSVVGIFGWAAAGLLGYFTLPWIGVALLVVVPVFFAVFSGGPTFETSHGTAHGSERRRGQPEPQT